MATLTTRIAEVLTAHRQADTPLRVLFCTCGESWRDEAELIRHQSLQIARALGSVPVA